MHKTAFWTAVAFGYAFLYVPIISLVVYSFNESKLVTVWGGFSTKWYTALMHNEAMLSAAWLSLRVAAISATMAVILGTLAGFALARLGRFRARPALALMIGAPLVMPEVILGLSALLWFVALQDMTGWPDGRGLLTISIAHTTFCSAYATVVIQSRLSQMDTSLEEAALDLGARPWKVFTHITLPIISPAMVAAWLLAFTLSLDDLVVASFTSGPGATTLPMVVYSSVRLGLSPEVNALATILIAVVSTGVGLAWWFMRRRANSNDTA